MRRLAVPIVLASALLAGCAARPERPTLVTLAELRSVEPDVEEATVERGLDQAMEGYRRFLEESPETAMTPEAMRRLADLQLEREFGIHTGDGKPREMAAPESAPMPAAADVAFAVTGSTESERDFVNRATAESADGPLEAIALYDRLLAEYPSYEHDDQVLYQKARAYGELGRVDEAMDTMERLIEANPHSAHYDEVQFRRGEYYFTRRKYRDAENAYSAILGLGAASSYYELALYKLGWTFYKQELYEEALHRYMALLDYKVETGYDFDAENGEEDERRVSDTYRAISLSFSYLGGPPEVERYFSTFGNRSYEDRVYAGLGEHYLAKLRYDDAAKTYRTFVKLYPFHRAAPRFGMRVVDTFTKGEFPKLVVEAKREFATRYGLSAEYWRHFDPADRPEVLAYVKSNLEDLATHYHAGYQSFEDGKEKIESYREALRWYGEYVASFPADEETPGIHYRMADLLLEHEDFGESARQYERTAYDYPLHERSEAAGYAAVYAYRRLLEVADETARDEIRRDTVASSLRFADTFPDHEQAATVLGAAADDLYEMEDYGAAVEAAQRVVDDYPRAETGIRRAAWIVVAHGSFDLDDYPRAENAYGQVLAATPRDDASYDGLVDNLAASIYRQGEIARAEEDYRAAADHFLRIRSAAPTSAIRPTAEYDAGAALMSLEDWTGAAGVLEAFRGTWPDHELALESTRMIALAYRQSGELSRAADEYDRIANRSEDPALRSEALLMAGDLYERSDDPSRALDVYTRYAEEFPEPVEMALETRAKIAEIHEAARDDALYVRELETIVRIDAEAGPERTPRTRTLAARSAQVLAERLYDEFLAVELLQPFEASLEEKKGRMDVALEAMGRLVDYEIADVTAAATYYMAEIYFDFSRSLAESERPADLEPADLDLYELALEEEAFPFEEKAIEVHEKNLEMLQAGVFNAWTEKSLGKLADLVPGRYAKHETSSGFIGAIDTYAYRSPASLIYGPTTLGAEPVETTLLETPAGGESEVDHADPR